MGMRRQIIELAEILTDGRTVWVNSAKGMCVGRFSAFGVDVHADYEAQTSGKSQCLDCVHDLPPRESWERFVKSMDTHYGIQIDDKFRPGFVT